jgi:hypothetical protein
MTQSAKEDVRWKQRLQNFSAAFAAELMRDGEGWMAMIDGRNLSAHTCNLEMANTLTRDVEGAVCGLLRSPQRPESGA